MTISQLITYYSKLLKSSSPVLDVELLLSQALNQSKEYLYTYPEKKLTASQLSKFKKLFARRLKGEPIAYIQGHKEFYGLNFKVTKNVLIPRPETEQLVEEALRFSKEHKILSLVEIGVGSGAVIISLAKNLPKAEFIGTDISDKAIAVAKKNAKFHKVKIHFFQGNLLKPLTEIINFQFLISNYIIAANLPYLDRKEKNLLPSSDTKGIKFEPKLAWDGGPDGLKYFREFFNQLHKYKLQPAAIFLEIGHNQAAKIIKLAKMSLPKYKTSVKNDLCGFDRLVIIYKQTAK
ncbi:MAG: peptide chain release factor N(5)-glutamine methyltransferase [Candidatus Parcubacteria bacterium]|nr:peptide chain release factor N(5)-glutamine methyltransferase [Candidatus Parcubacteria bacterium]